MGLSLKKINGGGWRKLAGAVSRRFPVLGAVRRPVVLRPLVNPRVPLGVFDHLRRR